MLYIKIPHLIAKLLTINSNIMNSKINFRAKLGLASKTICFAIAMFCLSIASFATNVKVHNNTDCTMQIKCYDNGRTYDMGSLYAGQSKNLYVEASYGQMYCNNKKTGQYADGIDFYNGHNNNLYVNNGCESTKSDNTQEPNTPDNTQECDNPTFDPCNNVNVLDFSQNGIDWSLNDEGGSYTVGDQTFDISLTDSEGIFAAYQEVQADLDDEGSYENNTGIAIGINPHSADDVIEINYDLSLVSDYVAFTIRDLDKKYYSGSQQIEEVCVYGYLGGQGSDEDEIEILPTITSLCGSVDVNGNCAIATTDSANGEDESIRVVFETCIDRIVIVYGNAEGAANDPTYSRIFIGDDIGFGTAVCSDACGTTCTAEGSSVTTADSSICLDSSGSVAISSDLVTLGNAGSGENSAWVVTDASAIVIEVAESLPITVNGENNYKVWYVNWDGDLSAPVVAGANAAEIVNNSECASLGTPGNINAINCCTAEASVIALEGAIGDSEGNVCSNSDTEIDVSLSGGNGENSAWVITDEQTNIISTSDTPPFVFNDAGSYLIWYVNWDGDLNAVPEVGANAGEIVGASECAVLSNSLKIDVTECCSATAAGISIDGGGETLDVCVNSEDLTAITFDLSDAGNGENSAWVITDENAIIKSVSAEVPSLDLYGTDLGTMVIWYLNWDGDLSAAPEAGANAAQIVENSECAALSNPVTIIKDCCCPYSIQFTEDNLLCSAGNLIFRPILVADQSLLLDDQTVICEKEGLDLLPCSDSPSVLDMNGDRALNPITVASDYTAIVTCTCAPDVNYTLTQELLDECTNSVPLVVVAPTPSIMNITETSATLSYVFDGAVTIEFKKTGDAEYVNFESVAGMAFLAGLESCTSYEYRSRVSDAEGNFVYGEIQTLTTSGCRNINIGDVNLRSLNVSSTTAILTWDNMPGCVYTIYYKVEGENEWHSYNTSIPFVVLFGLNPCTNYEWALKISEGDIVSNRSTTQLISTICQGPRLNNPNAVDVKIGDLGDLQNIELDLFVNPTTATLMVNYMGLPVSTASIYGVNGQLVNTLNIGNTTLNTIDVSNLDAGVYILVSNFDNGIAKNKFVINK